jgi:hypothetical protein
MINKSDSSPRFSWIDIFIICLLLLVAVFLRFSHLDTSHSVIGDELMWGNAANNLLKSPFLLLNPSHHYIFFPLHAEREYVQFNRTAAYPLLLSLPISLFGPNLFSLRLVSCLLGSGLLLLAYYLGFITAGRPTAAAATLLLAISPHTVMMSKLGLNEMTVTFLGYLVLILLFLFHQKLSLWSAVLIGLIAGYGYLIKPFQIAVIIVPASLVLLFYHFNWKKFRWFVYSGGTALGLIALLIITRAVITPWVFPFTWDSVWFSDHYPWQQGFEFYFITFIQNYGFALPLISISLTSLFVDKDLRQKHLFFSILAIAAMFIVISIPSTKRESYMLLVIPALLILAGHGLQILLRRKRFQWPYTATAGLVAAIVTIIALMSPESLAVDHFAQYIVVSPELSLIYMPAMAVAIAFVVLFLTVIPGAFWRYNISILSGMALSFVLIHLMLSTFNNYDDLNRPPNKDFKPEQFVSMLKSLERQFGRQRQFLAGDRLHAALIRFYGGSDIKPAWVPREDGERHSDGEVYDPVRLKIGVNRYIVFADSMQYTLAQFRRNGLPKDASNKTRGLYETLDYKYERMDKKILKQFGVDTRMHIYTLPHLNNFEFISSLFETE